MATSLIYFVMVFFLATLVPTPIGNMKDTKFKEAENFFIIPDALEDSDKAKQEFCSRYPYNSFNKTAVFYREVDCSDGKVSIPHIPHVCQDMPQDLQEAGIFDSMQWQNKTIYLYDKIGCNGDTIAINSEEDARNFCRTGWTDPNDKTGNRCRRIASFRVGDKKEESDSYYTCFLVSVFFNVVLVLPLLVVIFGLIYLFYKGKLKSLKQLFFSD